MANTNKRITDVDFVESLNSDESFFINQNNTIKQICRSDIVFDIINGGTGASTVSEARNNLGVYSTEEVDDLLSEKTNESHEHDASDITSGTLAVERLPIVPISNGGTGASDSETALKNLLQNNMILSSYQYGDVLPEAGVVGRIFFKKVNF